MAGRKNTVMAVLARRVQVADWYCKGRSQDWIGQQVGLSAAQVSRDLKWVREQWLARALEGRDKLVAKELAKLDAAEAEYWAAWERSKQPLENRVAEQASSDAGNAPAGKKRRERVSLTTRQRDGNPAFLDGVITCVRERVRVLGLAAPTKIDIEDDVRQWAIRAGYDPDEAVREAKRTIRLISSEGEAVEPDAAPARLVGQA